MKELLDLIEHALSLCENDKEQEIDTKRANQLDGMILAYKNIIKYIKYLLNK